MGIRHVLFSGIIVYSGLSGSAGASLPSALPVQLEERGFKVYQQTEGVWREIAFLPFDNFFSEHKLQLKSDEAPLRLRLEKAGSGPAHIDLARVHGSLPRTVNGTASSTAAMKFAEKDFDVFHVPEGDGGAIEMEFPTGGAFRFAARVESSTVAETPFRFPQPHTSISEKSDFYRLSPGDEPQVIFSEETSPATGHPWGLATASTRKDDRNLYVRLDFESDNTLDGGKDYASLHLRGGGELKTFTIRQDDGTWGRANFGYTPNIPWQHKIYDFIIPLAELPGTETIELAMSAYGTAGPGATSQSAPVLAYGAQNSEYMAAYHFEDLSGNYQIQTQRYDAEGNPVGMPSDLTENDILEKTNKDIAYDSVNDRFLVAWEQGDAGGRSIHRALVGSDNSQVEDEAIGGSLESQSPSVAFSEASRRFLVAWQENTTDGFDIMGSIISEDNAEIEPPITITSESSFQRRPGVAYLPGNNSFLVVWEDGRNGADADIWASLVEPGTPAVVGAPAMVRGGAGEQWQLDVAHDPTRQRSLVVWEDSPSTDVSDIHGIMLTNDNEPVGEAFVIAEPEGEQKYPQVAYAGNGVFLVIWQDQGVNPYEMHGRFYSSQGTPLGEEKLFTSLDSDEIFNPVLAGDGQGALLMAYNYTDISDSGNVKIGTESIEAPASGRIFLFMPAIINGAPAPIDNIEQQ